MIHDWQVLRKEIAREFREHPKDYLRQPTIRKTLNPLNPPLADDYVNDLFGPCPNMVELQHAWQLKQLRKYLGIHPHELAQVSEIGGGYGDMCRQFHEHGFRGIYEIFDFPELHAIQAAYLYESGIELNMTDSLGGGDLLLATFSLSEIPFAEREALEPAFGAYRYFMFSWNEKFGDMDNHRWFADLADRLADVFEIQTMKDPYMRGWYMFGRHK